MLVLVTIVYVLLVLHGSLAPFDLHADWDGESAHDCYAYGQSG